MSGTIYYPFSLLMNTIWWLTPNLFQQFTEAILKKQPALSSSKLTWTHPLFYSHQTCFSLVVLHGMKVRADPTTEVLYNSILMTANNESLKPPKLFAFECCQATPFTPERMNAYSVLSSRNFQLLSYDIGSKNELEWPVTTVQKLGRVIYVVSDKDLSSLERELEARRKLCLPNETSETSCMFVHRCVHVHIAQKNDFAPTIVSTYANPNAKLLFDDMIGQPTYFYPLVTHQLTIRDIGDIAPFPDSPDGRGCWFQTETNELMHLLKELEGLESEISCPPTPDHIFANRESDVGMTLEESILTATHTPERTGAVGIAEPDIGLDESDWQFLQRTPIIYSNASPTFPDVFPAIPFASPTGSSSASSAYLVVPTNSPIPQSYPSPRTLDATIHGIANCSFFEQEPLPPASLEERLSLAEHCHGRLVRQTDCERYWTDDQHTLHEFLRMFYQRGELLSTHDQVDTLDVFFDIESIQYMIRVTPHVVVQYFFQDQTFFDQWMFALYLASRSFFHSLHSIGCKREGSLSCGKDSLFAHELQLCPSTTYQEICTGAKSTWTCQMCDGKDHLLPTPPSIGERQLQASDTKETSQCAICFRSMSCYLPQFQHSYQQFLKENRAAESSEKENGEEEAEEIFYRDVLPWCDSLMYCQLSCRCLKRDQCLMCMISLHAAANMTPDFQEVEEPHWCLCLQHQAADSTHFNVLTRGQFASADKMVNFHLRLTYWWFVQMRSYLQRRETTKPYSNVILLAISSAYEERLLPGYCRVDPISIDDTLCVCYDLLPESDSARNMKFSFYTDSSQMGAAFSELDSETAKNVIQVWCFRVQDTWVAPLIQEQVKAVGRPLLAVTVTDYVMNTHVDDVAALYKQLQHSEVLFCRNTMDGKITPR
jgi:hypothetical protein